MNKFIDAMGLACPMPVVLTKDALKELPSGESTVTKVDNQISAQNLQKFAKVRGYASSTVKNSDGTYEVTITKSQDAREHIDSMEDLDILDCKFGPSDYVVAIGSDKMGDGQEELSKILMKSFIFALSKQDLLPGHILFYNAGAFITTQQSDMLHDLQEMEKAGVKIHTCGTCLDYYHIKDQLKVGDVSNMYEIVEILTSAAKVIKP